ncbi:MAG: hypothetical protein U5R30_10305 [Deltaproteobacteria bacterium]|nr:hypothetical protein [Deltaproteobacteria bacterium]
MQFQQCAVNGFTDSQACPDKADDGQHDRKSGDADQHQPVFQVGPKTAVKRFPGYARQQKIDAPQRGDTGKTENTDVGVGHHPVVEVGNTLDNRQRHHRYPGY